MAVKTSRNRNRKEFQKSRGT